MSCSRMTTRFLSHVLVISGLFLDIILFYEVIYFTPYIDETSYSPFPRKRSRLLHMSQSVTTVGKQPLTVSARVFLLLHLFHMSQDVT